MEEPKQYSVKEYMLFKLDRNIAILGLVVIGIASLVIGSAASEKIAMGVISALAVYLGARGAK